MPERLAMGGDEIVVRATSAETGGALFAVEVRMPPGGGPPVLHRHGPGEIYLMLEGELTFYAGEGDDVRRWTARPGQVVPLAGGTRHSIRNESTADARAFVVHAPGAPMEGFVRAVAELEPGHGMGEVLDVAARHGIELLGPVPGVPPRSSA